MALKISGTTVIDDNKNIVSGTPLVRGTVVTASSLNIPTGNTAGRPATPSVGQIYFDTDEGKVIVYNGTSWV